MSRSSSSKHRKDINKKFEDVEAKIEKQVKATSAMMSVDEGIKNKKSEYKLSKMQSAVVEVVEKKKNVFFTGVAGTGKSFLLSYLMSHVLPMNKTAVTSSTGTTAYNISGMTLHSFAGIHLGEESVDVLYDRVLKNAPCRKRWREIDCLIIDEISMIPGELFDKLELIARRVRGKSAPFGGIQLILCGDFLQLPPVNAKFCFQAECWNRVVQEKVELNKVYRQNDDKFISALEEMRMGKIPKDYKMFEACVGRELKIPTVSTSSSAYRGKIEATKLYAKKKYVEPINIEKLLELKTEVHEYDAICTGDVKSIEKMKKDFNGSANLSLAIGAQVMLVKNINVLGGLTNGSRGIVVDFVEDDAPNEDPLDQKGSAKAKAKAKSKFKKLAPPKNKSKILDDDDDEEEEKEEDYASDEDLDDPRESKMLYPVVQFVNGRTEVIKHGKWEIKFQNRTIARLLQIPLILSWCVTIHKIQGMTLDLVEIDMESMFDNDGDAQAYVCIFSSQEFGRFEID